MVDPNFSDQEKACIRALAKLFERGVAYVADPLIQLNAEGLDLDPGAYHRLMPMMEHYGVIEDLDGTMSEAHIPFRISPSAVEVARALSHAEKQAEQPRDIVEQVKSAFQLLKNFKVID